MQVDEHYLPYIFLCQRDGEVGCQSGGSGAALGALKDQQLAGGSLDHQRNMARGGARKASAIEVAVIGEARNSRARRAWRNNHIRRVLRRTGHDRYGNVRRQIASINRVPLHSGVEVHNDQVAAPSISLEMTLRWDIRKIPGDPGLHQSHRFRDRRRWRHPARSAH